MLTGTSGESAAAFIASYFRPPAAAIHRFPSSRRVGPRRVTMHTRERWACFRLGVLTACWTWAQTAAELRARFDITRRVPGVRRITSARRVAWRNLAALVRKGFLVRCDDGYRTTERGRRVLADLRALELDDVEAVAP